VDVRIKLPGAFRFKVGGVTEINVEIDPGGNTVLHVLERLIVSYPELRRSLYAPDGRFRPTVQIYVNDEHVRFRQGLQTVLQPGDLVYVVPMVMGG
jgi:adenylyltransferase/sulfurtransferase